MIRDLVFVALALLCVVPAVWVVFSRHIVHAGFALLFTLLGVSGMYAFLGADFLAVTQVMVYVGGVLVLVLFTVMMTHVPSHARRRHGLDRLVPPAVFAAAVFGVLYKVITATRWQASPAEAKATTAEIGAQFMTTYLFPFEYVSLVLLMAMVGAAILIRERRHAGADDQDAPEVRP